jgi:hypothetical protein
LTEVTEARAKATMVQVNANDLTDPAALQRFQQAQAQLSGALGRLLAVSEMYPDLKSNQNFLALQSQLEGTENRITVARRDYIQAVQAYNTTVQTFPGASGRGSTVPSRWRHLPPRKRINGRPPFSSELAYGALRGSSVLLFRSVCD